MGTQIFVTFFIVEKKHTTENVSSEPFLCSIVLSIFALLCEQLQNFLILKNRNFIPIKQYLFIPQSSQSLATTTLLSVYMNLLPTLHMSGIITESVFWAIPVSVYKHIKHGQSLKECKQYA